MALIHNSGGDPVLFPRDQSFSDLTASLPADNFKGYYHSVDMDQRSQFVDPTRNAFDTYQVTSTQPTTAAYHESSRSHLNSVKAGDEASMPRPTPSASPSSMSQTFDPSSSVLSSTSGASAASSVGGSPYARPTQQMPFQDKWSSPIEGLGISSGVVSGDYYGYDVSRQDFVGEYDENILSLLPCTGVSASSISLASATQEFPSPYYVSRSELLAESHKGGITIDTILCEIERKNRHHASTISPVSSSSTTVPPPTFPGIACDQDSPIKHGLFSPQLRNPALTMPQQSSVSPPESDAPDLGMHPSHGSLTPPSNSPSSSRKHQDSFFSQSSGRFVAPIYSSCWFSFTSPCLHLCGLAFCVF